MIVGLGNKSKTIYKNYLCVTISLLQVPGRPELVGSYFTIFSYTNCVPWSSTSLKKYTPELKTATGNFMSSLLSEVFYKCVQNHSAGLICYLNMIFAFFNFKKNVIIKWIWVYTVLCKVVKQLNYGRKTFNSILIYNF